MDAAGNVCKVQRNGFDLSGDCYIIELSEIWEEDEMKILIVVDMQNDFIDGALGTEEALKIVPKVAEKIRGFDGKIFFTRDTHEDGYLESQEGKNLPVVHCVRGTKGWELYPEIEALRKEGDQVIDKPSFGSIELGHRLREYMTELSIKGESKVESIAFVGLCTDICVISNAMITKAFFPEIPVLVDASCCAGVTPESHDTALKSMEMCQIQIV